MYLFLNNKETTIYTLYTPYIHYNTKFFYLQRNLVRMVQQK